MEARLTWSYALTPSTERMVWSGSSSVVSCKVWISASVPARVDNAYW